MKDKKRILLAHGSGGKMMHDLIGNVFRKHFQNRYLDQLADSAMIDLCDINSSQKLCFTTDSYVVNPLVFPGGDIGKLAICGTVNDLAVMGAVPKYISCGFIVEEGFELDTLDEIVKSMAETAAAADVMIVTGDIKVVEKGNVDKLFINTSGVGMTIAGMAISRQEIVPGDQIIVNGSLGEHELAVLVARGELHLQAQIFSDCAPLAGLIQKVLELKPEIKIMRDPTRGGLATTLNELAANNDFSFKIDETKIPIKKEVRAICELLGYDPLYLANEGKIAIVVAQDDAKRVLQEMKKHSLGKDSCIIGEVIAEPKGKVLLQTKIGGTRIVDMLTGVQLPRIC